MLLTRCYTIGLPGGASGKQLACQCRGHKRCVFDPWFGKVPWRRALQPTPVFLPGESHEQQSLASYSPWGSQRVGHNWNDLAESSTRKEKVTLSWVLKDTQPKMLWKIPAERGRGALLGALRRGFAESWKEAREEKTKTGHESLWSSWPFSWSHSKPLTDILQASDKLRLTV